MMYIHGESYEWNSGNPYDGSVLASFGNVVVITINYRLGVLGFLPAMEGSARGNYGLMDQVAALHWIQENVAEFGGDPRNVTLFGHGQGAACVNLLMLSPMAKGLFQRAIIQSGSALSPWAIAREALTYTRHLARVLGCPIQESNALVDCMRERPVADIMRVQLLVPAHLTAFGPTIDGVMVPDEPTALMEEYTELYGQYDLLFGVSRVESFFQFSAQEEKHGIENDRRDRLLRTLVRNLFTYHLQEIFLTIVNEYTDWTRPVQHPINVLDGTSDALGDALVVAPLIRAGNYHSLVKTNSFYYVFGYQTEDSHYSQRVGCVHNEDLPYIFGAPLIGQLGHFYSNYTRAEILLAEAVVLYWTNFARNGDPNMAGHEADVASDKGRGRYERLLWPRYENMHQKFLLLGTKPKVRDHYHAHRLSVWLHLFPTLHQTIAVGAAPQHHLLEDHDNAQTYDGIVRQVPLNMPQTTTTTLQPTTTTTTRKPPPPPPHTFYITRPRLRATRQPPRVTSLYQNDVITPTVQPTESLENVVPSGVYSTALSVTIAVGCSLLILNVLIFASVYYQRENSATVTKPRSRKHSLARSYTGPPMNTTPQLKQPLLRVLPVTTDANCSIPSPRYVSPPSQFQGRTLNSVSPKSPTSKTPNSSLPGNSVPESIPLLPQGIIRTAVITTKPLEQVQNA
ncbi:neuroligin-3-like [Centruroides sculpturatus]|uniref:neuroligin-3-like n=1 Tax=Centruroides sculpturatus TaxID=218467 RepID=UPI000C6DAEF1|nr:neuroligin-3-like [Centruroides sculpturatus]